MRISCTRFSGFALTISVVLGAAAQAGDWPQILGPNRDGAAVGEKLIPKWPQDGPLEIWSDKVGEGFAGVAVKNGVLILFHRTGDSEVVEARDALTGKVRWSVKFGCDYQSGMSSDNGPRCVPVVADDYIYVYGVQGMLRCLESASGKEVWSRNTWSTLR